MHRLTDRPWTCSIQMAMIALEEVTQYVGCSIESTAFFLFTPSAFFPLFSSVTGQCLIESLNVRSVMTSHWSIAIYMCHLCVWSHFAQSTIANSPTRSAKYGQVAKSLRLLSQFLFDARTRLTTMLTVLQQCLLHCDKFL